MTYDFLFVLTSVLCVEADGNADRIISDFSRVVVAVDIGKICFWEVSFKDWEKRDFLSEETKKASSLVEAI